MIRNAVLALVATSAVAQATPIPTDSTIPDVAERVVESVVSISTTHVVQSRSMFDDDAEQKMQALGSGVIVTPGGRILTNSHVVNGATDITVTLPDGNEMPAKVVGNDPSADVAVIQLDGKVPSLKPITIGDSTSLRLGEVVLAVGNPLGVGKSVTMGIVSAKGRGGLGIEDFEDFIQTDAAINHGNSGGALVNMRGELIGINTAIFPDQRGSYSGIGFAIPTSMARPIMDMLVKTGKVTRGYLGAGIQTVTLALATKFKLGASRGAVITHVEPGSPGAQAGLLEGDVVTSLSGAPIVSGDVLRNQIAMSAPNTLVELEVVHFQSNAHQTLKVKLGERPDMQRKATLRRRP